MTSWSLADYADTNTKCSNLWTKIYQTDALLLIEKRILFNFTKIFCIISTFFCDLHLAICSIYFAEDLYYSVAENEANEEVADQDKPLAKLAGKGTNLFRKIDLCFCWRTYNVLNKILRHRNRKWELRYSSNLQLEMVYWYAKLTSKIFSILFLHFNQHRKFQWWKWMGANEKGCDIFTIIIWFLKFHFHEWKLFEKSICNSFHQNGRIFWKFIVLDENHFWYFPSLLVDLEK